MTLDLDKIRAAIAVIEKWETDHDEAEFHCVLDAARAYLALVSGEPSAAMKGPSS